MDLEFVLYNPERPSVMDGVVIVTSQGLLLHAVSYSENFGLPNETDRYNLGATIVLLRGAAEASLSNLSFESTDVTFADDCAGAVVLALFSQPGVHEHDRQELANDIMSSVASQHGPTIQAAAGQPSLLQKCFLDFDQVSERGPALSRRRSRVSPTLTHTHSQVVQQCCLRSLARTLEILSDSYQHTPWFLAVYREDELQAAGCGGMNRSSSNSAEATWHDEDAGALFNTVFHAPRKEDKHQAELRLAAPVPPDQSGHLTPNASRPRPRARLRPGRMLRVASGLSSTMQRWRRGRPDVALTEQNALPRDVHKQQIVVAPPSTARVRWKAVAVTVPSGRRDEASTLPGPDRQKELALALAGRFPGGNAGGTRPAVVHIGEPEGETLLLWRREGRAGQGRTFLACPRTRASLGMDEPEARALLKSADLQRTMALVFRLLQVRELGSDFECGSASGARR